MAPRSKKFSKPLRRGVAKRRAPRRVGITRNPNIVGGPNTCTIQQTLPSVPLLANAPYRISVGGLTGLRALAVAEQFGLYRIAKVVYKYKPQADTFTSNGGALGGSGAVTVPYLYWKMNRFADNPAAWALEDIQAMGAKPFRFDDKTISVAYRPNILTGIASGGDNSGSVKLTPWLNTDSSPETPGFAPSDTEHYGHFFMIAAATSGDGSTPVGTLDVTIYYEFKNPRVEWTHTGIASVNPLAH